LTLEAEHPVLFTPRAAENYRLLKNRADACVKRGDLSSSEATVFRALEQLLKELPGHGAFLPENALAGPLSMCYVAVIGPLRMYYTRALRPNGLLIFHFWNKTSGFDPYEAFHKIASSPKFDAIAREMGLPVPDRTGGAKPPPVQ
jgi:hypothetical protein